METSKPIKIQKNVPLPMLAASSERVKKSFRSEIRAILTKMQVGDSFEIEAKNTNNISNTAHTVSAEQKKTFTVRKLGKGKTEEMFIFGVWRTK